MKRAFSQEIEVHKKLKAEPAWTCSGDRQEKEEALAQFTRMKAEKSSKNHEEFSEVCALLKHGDLHSEFRYLVPSIMPEFLCILRILLALPPQEKSFPDSLARLVVSRLLMAFWKNI